MRRLFLAGFFRPQPAMEGGGEQPEPLLKGSLRCIDNKLPLGGFCVRRIYLYTITIGKTSSAMFKQQPEFTEKRDCFDCPMFE